MSENGINWYTLIYPAIAIPLAILGIVRWRIIRKRQLEQARVVTNNDNSGFSAQDFVLGNPFNTHQNAPVYNIEQPVVNQNPKDIFQHDPKKVQEEPPPMIKTKRWF